MSTEAELTAQIVGLGEEIKQAKADKKPKEEWDRFLQEMLALKVRSDQDRFFFSKYHGLSINFVVAVVFIDSVQGGDRQRLWGPS
jgi:hypothetical protein